MSTNEDSGRSDDDEEKEDKSVIFVRKLQRKKLRPREVIKKSNKTMRAIKKKYGTRFMTVEQYCNKTGNKFYNDHQRHMQVIS